MKRWTCSFCGKDRFKIGMWRAKVCQHCGQMELDDGTTLKGDYAHFVVVTEHDGGDSGPLVFEQYIASSDYAEIVDRAKYLSKRYGEVRIARLDYNIGPEMYFRHGKRYQALPEICNAFPRKGET